MPFSHLQILLRAVGIAFCFLIPDLVWAQSGTLVGTVTDSQSGEPLPGASVQIIGTSLGTATNLEGRYSINAIQAGQQKVRISYIGYQTLEVVVQIERSQTTTLNAELEFGVIEGEEIIVTAQAAGQVAAINQQLTSNTITNVVSAERIQELPDQNAAESVGRLPGISIERDAGEGQKVIIRGLSPKFNAITVNGERIPSTDGDDRSVDLSMISPDPYLVELKCLKH